MRWILALGLAASLTACTKNKPNDAASQAEGKAEGQAQATAPKSGMPSNKLLTIGISQEFETLNPIVAQMYASTYVGRMAVHALVAIDADWQWRCWLCKELPSLENGLAKLTEQGGSKKLEVSWEIKDNAVWGDGTPITGNDIKKSWEIGRDPAVSTGERDTYEKVEAIEVDPANPKKLVMRFKEARYDFFQLGTFYVLPAHIEGPIFDKAKGQTGAYEKLTAYNTDSANPGLYSGPYLVKEIKLGSHIIFERNPKFYGTPAKIERIIVKLIPNTQTLEANLVSGEIDMIAELGLGFDQALAFDKRINQDANLKSRFQVQFADGLTYEHIDLNLRNPLLADKNVRQALVYAIDRDKIAQALFENRQKKALSVFHPRDVYFSENVKQYAHDPKKAAELLEAAGWKLGANGIRSKDGQKLQFVFMTTAGNKTRELVQGVLKEQWRQVGVEVTIDNQPARVFFGETVKKGRYPGMAMFAWVSAPDNPPRSSLHSAEIPTDKNGHSGQNSGGFANAKVDQLLDATKTEFDVQKRKQNMLELMQIYTEEVPVIPLFLRAEVVVVPTNLQGFRMTGHQFPSTLSVEHWDLSPTAQGH